MKMIHVSEEVIETVWRFEERGGCTVEDVKKEHEESRDYIVDDELLAELEKSGLLKISGRAISLTTEGKTQARPIIRRHRLAERLLVDVLGMPFEEIEESACEYEHTLAPGLTEAICTLLGHPRECPHGSPIPEGECCHRAESSVQSFVKSLSALEVGDEVRISFIRKDDPVLIGKLVSFGVSPGKILKIRQKFPAYVIQIDHSQIALEQDIAADIFGLKV
ncbi:MAG TPA: metal-dependent transcriptional regulator [Desulfuromonadales bacterium]|nr:metal-dependent transcriptional regulator [Desulfuromonadales bacterium]